MNLHYGRPGAVDFATVVHQTSDWNLSQPSRSTVASLAYWRDFTARLSTLLQGLGAQQFGNAALCFEFPVPSSKSRNKPSFTDVMYYDDNSAVAIENKWTEKPDKAVKRWLAAGDHPKNREDVLKHWVGLIGSRYACVDEAALRNVNVPYQLVHRTASGCSLSKGRIFIVLQLFVPCNHGDKHRLALRILVDAIRPKDNLEIWLHTVQAEKTRLFNETERSMPKVGNAERSIILRRALLSGHLFHFGSEKFERIRTSTH